jgi:hypothetical protein
MTKDIYEVKVLCYLVSASEHMSLKMSYMGESRKEDVEVAKTVEMKPHAYGSSLPLVEAIEEQEKQVED